MYINYLWYEFMINFSFKSLFFIFFIGFYSLSFADNIEDVSKFNIENEVAGLSNPDSKSLLEDTNFNMNIDFYEFTDLGNQNKDVIHYRSSGCSVGCSTGCSTGCSVGCSAGCSSGCSSGCRGW